MAASSADTNAEAVSLLRLSDSIRAALAEKGTFGPSADRLSVFLEKTTYNEIKGTPIIDFETLKQACLDKLVAEISGQAKSSTAIMPQLINEIVAASNLQRLWRVRFKERYFMLDEIRSRELTKCGRLKDVVFITRQKGGTPIESVWKARVVDPTVQIECNLQFTAGQ